MRESERYAEFTSGLCKGGSMCVCVCLCVFVHVYMYVCVYVHVYALCWSRQLQGQFGELLLFGHNYPNCPAFPRVALHMYMSLCTYLYTYTYTLGGFQTLWNALLRCWTPLDHPK